MKPLLVLYGSQTGNAAEIAKQIAAACPAKHIRVQCMAMEATTWETALSDGAVVRARPWRRCD